jgi:hypothetical protein
MMEPAGWRRYKPGQVRTPPIPLPKSPPVPCPPEELQRWFDALRKYDRDATQYAAREIVLPRLEAAGVPPHRELAEAETWFSFSMYLMITLSEVLRQDPLPAWLGELVGDLCRFGMETPDGSEFTRPAELIRWLGTGPKIRALVPLEALEAYTLIDQWEEDERRRAEMSSY